MGTTVGVDWKLERGLVVRMILAIAFLAVLPVAFAYTLQLSLNHVVGPVVSALTDTPIDIQVSIPLWLIVVGTVVGYTLQYTLGDRVALRAVDARIVDADTEPALSGRIQRLAAQAGVPAPAVAVSESDVPNAFAVGRRAGSSTIVVTRGLLETLDDEQLDAVLAHELAHVKNRDVAVMSLAYFLPTLTYVVAIVAYGILTRIPHVFRHVEFDDEDGAKAFLIIVTVLVVSSIVTIAVATLFWLASFLLFRLLSQYREYAADRGAAAITGDPTALATALEVLDREMSDLPDEDLRTVDGGIEALYVAPIDADQFANRRQLISADLFFPDTHPPMDERLDQLRSMTAELEA
jgi:heat shock protein HtpX